jgi:tricorn protease
MKKHLLLVLPALLACISIFAQAPSIHFTDQPCLTPDGETLIFVHAGDLWKVPANGGLATRLTAMEGDERMPKVSPDGKWLAFSAAQASNIDVYLLPLAGGEIKRLTWHEAGDIVSNWTWDSKTIYFTSTRVNRRSTFSIGIGGGTPKQLFSNYFHLVHDFCEHPNGEYFFNESGESYGSTLQRKGYKGDHNPDLQSYNPKTREYKQLTDWRGKDFGATIDRQGNIYFVSDEYNGEYNLYEWDNGKKKRITEFTTSIWYPSVAANGSKIAFRKDYQIFTLNPKSGKSEKVNIQVPQNGLLELEQDFNVKGKISNFDVSEDGKKMAFVSRGEIFVSDVKGKFIQQVKSPNRGRVMEVFWLKDNKNLLYSSTNAKGHQNWFTQAADGSVPEKQLSNDAHNNRSLSFNSDRSKAIYLSGRHEMRMMDLKDFSIKTVLRDEFWDLYNETPYFGNDDQSILFSAYRNFERDVFVHNLTTSTTVNLSNTGVTEAAPVWSPDGKYIYFASNRTKASYPFGLQDANIYRLPLENYDTPYRSDKWKELFTESTKPAEVKPTDAKPTDPKTAESKPTEPKPAEPKKDSVKLKPAIKIDLNKPMERLEQVGPGFGNQFSPYVVKKDDKTSIIYASNHDEGRTNLWKTTLEPFEQPKTEQISGAGTGEVFIRQAKGTYYCLVNGNICNFSVDGNKADVINMDFKFRRDLQSEFEQMFHETWANLDQNFYDEKFHGKDWKAIHDRYATYLSHLNKRADLRVLINDMLGELNASHTGFSSGGDEETIYFKSRSAGTGIVFSNDNPYVVDRIVARSPAERQGKDLQKGDRLVKVNGAAVNEQENREMYFSQPSLDEEISLTFQRGDKTIDLNLHPVSTFQINDLMYDEWEEACQKRVDEKGKNRIAYAHMKDMGTGELDKFLRDMVSEGHNREAVIVDLRYNNGGNVHDNVLQFLAQKPYLNWKYREGKLTPQPNFGPASKPIVLLINEASLSDAEMTAEGFQTLKLGQIVGTETYRWIIFTSGKGLVDGSFYRLPSWGCYTLEGKDLEFEGVKPDVYVKNTFKDRLENRDPQLDKAIDLILGQLK